MNRIDIINALISKNKYKSYLEIGIQDAICFSEINCENKIGIDPDRGSAATLFITSDKFFETYPDKFDIIFIDGAHTHAQVYNDINNALGHLNPKGIIICHDMLPNSKESSENPLMNGDCWKAFLDFRKRSDLDMCVVDTDQGCGIIKRGSQRPVMIPGEQYTYEEFSKNKYSWMNIISVSLFQRRFLV